MPDNEEQIAYWNGKAGETWVEAHSRLDAMLAPLSEMALRKAAPGPGARVVDVGCGCGTTSIALARQGASVWGIDISAPMLARARELAEGVDNIEFSQADAASVTLTPDHQLAFSRFGVMFFADPVAAFTNLRTGLAAGGRLVFLCWQAAQANPWIAVTAAAVQPFLPAPEETPDPRAPGPFAFAQEDYVVDILQSAGYANIACEPVTATLKLGDSLDQAMQFQSQIGPISRVLSELDDDARPQALAAAREALAGHLSDDGVSLDAACWLVSATSEPG